MKNNNTLPQTGWAEFWQFLKRYFAREWHFFLSGGVFALLTALCAGGYLRVVSYIGTSLQMQIERPEQDWQGWIIPGILAIAVLAFGRAITLYAMTMFNNTAVQRGLVNMQAVQFLALNRGDYARLASDASGEFVARFINDVNTVRDAILRLANNSIKSFATVIAVFSWLFWQDWQLGFIIVFIYPLALGPVLALGEAVRSRAKRAQEQIGEVSAFLTEAFQSSRIIRAFGLEFYQEERAEKAFKERSSLFLRVLSQRAAIDPILEVAGGLALAGLLAYTAWKISVGANTIGDLLGIIAALGIVAPEIRALGSLSAVAQEGRAASERMQAIIDTPSRVKETPNAKPLLSPKGRIQFDNVEFAYPDGTKALSGLSFVIEPGQSIAIVGPSGAGKSTLFNLLLRLYDCQSGRICIDEQNIKELQLTSLRTAMAIVSQEPALFDDSLIQNIRLGRLDASDADIIAAAKMANAHIFIENSTEGYQSRAGELGRNLSGGQRQRIALARAILRKAPIMLLDEATSALDSESETKIQDALARLKGRQTLLVIAHRLSTIRNADNILVLDQGVLVESGTHATLMAANGAYASLAKSQFSA